MHARRCGACAARIRPHALEPDLSTGLRDEDRGDRTQTDVTRRPRRDWCCSAGDAAFPPRLQSSSGTGSARGLARNPLTTSDIGWVQGERGAGGRTASLRCGWSGVIKMPPSSPPRLPRLTGSFTPLTYRPKRPTAARTCNFGVVGIGSNGRDCRRLLKGTPRSGRVDRCNHCRRYPDRMNKGTEP